MTHRLDKKTKGDKAYRKKEEEKKNGDIGHVSKSNEKKGKKWGKKKIEKIDEKIFFFFFKGWTYLSFLHFAHQNFPLWGEKRKEKIAMKVDHKIRIKNDEDEDGIYI